jgi:hypothetical protein
MVGEGEDGGSFRSLKPIVSDMQELLIWLKIKEQLT